MKPFTLWIDPTSATPARPADGFCPEGNVAKTTECGEIVVFTLKTAVRMYFRRDMGNRKSVLCYEGWE